MENGDPHEIEEFRANAFSILGLILIGVISALASGYLLASIVAVFPLSLVGLGAFAGLLVFWLILRLLVVRRAFKMLVVKASTLETPPVETPKD